MTTAEAAEAPHPQVDSRWWYWIAAVPVVAVVGLLFGVAVAVLVVTSLPAGGPPNGGFDALPGSVRLAILLAIPMALLGLVVAVGAALGFYFDSKAVVAADLDWEPDPVLWGVVGAVGIFFQLVQLGGAVYYLYKRHETVGTP